MYMAWPVAWKCRSRIWVWQGAWTSRFDIFGVGKGHGHVDFGLLGWVVVGISMLVVVVRLPSYCYAFRRAGGVHVVALPLADDDGSEALVGRLFGFHP